MKKLMMIPLLLLLAGCDALPTGDKDTTQKQQAITDQAKSQVGFPGVTKFTEKRIVKKLYELRDRNIETYTYLRDMQGHLWHVCDSIGYPLPYGVQFTAPERPALYSETSEHGNLALPQPEPNGLFMPPTAEGTWIFCIDENKPADPQPLYVEERVLVSPFKLAAIGDYQVKK